MPVGRPPQPLGSDFVSIKLSPELRAIAKKLGDGIITHGIRIALAATVNELRRKNEVAALLAASEQINAQLDILSAKRHEISEQIYTIQCDYKKETEK